MTKDEDYALEIRVKLDADTREEAEAQAEHVVAATLLAPEAGELVESTVYTY